MAYGHSYRRIAELLRLSPETVRTFIRQIYDRLGVSSKAECLTAAYERGLLLSPDSPVFPAIP
jgi:DNA-binding CsgD family transcriptional regulator